MRARNRLSVRVVQSTKPVRQSEWAGISPNLLINWRNYSSQVLLRGEQTQPSSQWMKFRNIRNIISNNTPQPSIVLRRYQSGEDKFQYPKLRVTKKEMRGRPKKQKETVTVPILQVGGFICVGIPLGYVALKILDILDTDLGNKPRVRDV